MPRLVKDENAVDAAVFRTVDLQRKFHRSAAGLAEAVALTGPKATALRAHLGIDDDDSCRHVFEFGKAKHARYSDNAYTRMRDSLANGVDMVAVWAAHRPGGGKRGSCTQPGCAARAAATKASWPLCCPQMSTVLVLRRAGSSASSSRRHTSAGPGQPRDNAAGS